VGSRPRWIQAGSADRIDDWQAVVAQVRAEHLRKSSFVPRVQGLVHDPGPEPSFLDRTPSCWMPAISC
jgi:hypothetical protein